MSLLAPTYVTDSTKRYTRLQNFDVFLKTTVSDYVLITVPFKALSTQLISLNPETVEIFETQLETKSLNNLMSVGD